MSWRTRINLTVIWIVSLVAIAAWARTQTPPEEKLPTPIMISGNDLAYRLDGGRGTYAPGTSPHAGRRPMGHCPSEILSCSCAN
jgi:hypothetical protein